MSAIALLFAVATLACGNASDGPVTVVTVDSAALDDVAAIDGSVAADGEARDTETTTDSGPTDTSAPIDSGSSALAIGASAVKQRIYSTAPTTGTLTTSAVTTHATGSIMLASVARGTWSAAPDAPTDNKGNPFALLGSTHSYGAWPASKTGTYDVIGAAGGAGHTFSMTWGNIGSSGDEVTISAVEVVGANSIEDSSWVERASGTSLTSASVTTKGPAILVAWWWGSGTVRPLGTNHVASPGSGFALIPGATALTSISTNGYVQVAAASRIVAAAGTYTITWTTDGEGAQLYLVAIR